MGLLAIILLSSLSALALWRFGRLSKDALMLVGAALALGAAGYALQGQPGLAGSPAQAPLPVAAVLPESNQRAELMGRFGSEAERLSQAEAYMQVGNPEVAFAVLKGGLAQNENSPQLWTGMGNALMVQGKGNMSPAAEYSFRRALAISPNYPGTLYFYGLALADTGRTDEARDMWLTLLRVVPVDAPQRLDLISQLTETGLITDKDIAANK